MAAAPALRPPRRFLLWVVEERGEFVVVLEDAREVVGETMAHPERFAEPEAVARYVRYVLQQWRESRS